MRVGDGPASTDSATLPANTRPTPERCDEPTAMSAASTSAAKPCRPAAGDRSDTSRATRSVTLRSATWEKTLQLDFGGAPSVVAGGRAVATRDALHVFLDGAHHVFTVADPYLPSSERVDAQGGLTAPMPGRVLAVLVKTGQRVARGAPLMIMEAMKMEHTVTAPADGIVAKLLCAEGEQVREGAELLTLAPL